MAGLFVTGTDTGVGKTVLAAAVCAALAARDLPVLAHKPVVTGTDDHDPAWPADHELLGAVCDMPPEAVAPLRFGPAVSPHLAAELAGVSLDFDRIVAVARAALAGPSSAVVEGVGGLLVPLTREATVRDLARELALPLVIAARPGLGTISHTLLTLECARAAALDVRAVVLTPWPDRPDSVERSNAETIARLGGVPVHGLARVASPQPRALAAAGAALPIDAWLGRR